VDADEVIDLCDRRIAEEEQHARLVGDAVYTLKALMDKKGQ